MFQWGESRWGLVLEGLLILIVGTYTGQDSIWACTPFDPELS